MTPDTVHTIPDDIHEAAKASADALITRMCVTMDHSFGLQSEQEQRGLRTSMSQLVEHDIAPAIAKAINDAVMAERNASAHRWLDMSGAPREGRFLAVVDGEVRTVAYCKTSHVPVHGFCLVDQGAEDSELCKPSCWMPLPAALKAEGV